MAYVQVGSVAGSLGGQSLTTTGTITGGTITATTAFTSSAGYIGIGATLPTTGALRFANDTTIVAARTSGGANAALLTFDSSNQLFVGATGGGGGTVNIYSIATNASIFQIGGVNSLDLRSSSVTVGSSVQLILTSVGTSSGGIKYGTSGPVDLAGPGTPEGAVTAPVGSTWRRTDGGAGTCFYVKESGAGNTGWVAK